MTVLTGTGVTQQIRKMVGDTYIGRFSNDSANGG